MELVVGNTYIYKGKTTKLISKWAQGNWYTYTFEDGRSFNGNPEPLLASGEIVAIGVTPSVPATPHQHWQAPMSHPTQKEEREEKRGKTA